MKSSTILGRAALFFSFVQYGVVASTHVLVCDLSAPIALDASGDVELRHFMNEEEGTYTMELTYYGSRRYLAIGINQDGVPLMTPSIAIVGRSDEGSPTVEKYNLVSTSGVQLAESQEGLFNSSFVQTDSTSVLTFTQLLNQDGLAPVTDDTQWIYAVGRSGNRFGGHALRGAFQLSLARICGDEGSSEAGITVSELDLPDRGIWLAHGILMALAWAFCAPVAIGASLLRTAFNQIGAASNRKGLWFKIHLYMNVLTTLFTVAGFIIAKVAASDRPEKNVSVHARMGAAIFVMILVQSVAGVFRPSLPKSSSQAAGKSMGDENKTDSKELEKTERGASDQNLDDASTDDVPSKSSVRVGWEWGHRLAGLALLAMAWYNCHTGIEWSSNIWEENGDWTGAFWGVVGGLGGLIVVSKIALQAREKNVCKLCTLVKHVV